MKLIGKLVELAATYVKKVVFVENFTKVQRFRLDQQVYVTRLSEHDAARRRAHDALISQLTIVNRNLFQDEFLEGEVPVGGIYSLDPDTIRNRVAVAKWAGHLARALAQRGTVSLI